jgi:hypothetical protein
VVAAGTAHGFDGLERATAGENTPTKEPSLVGTQQVVTPDQRVQHRRAGLWDGKTCGGYSGGALVDVVQPFSTGCEWTGPVSGRSDGSGVCSPRVRCGRCWL